MQNAIFRALRDFADKVKARFSTPFAGEPEAQLSGPASSLLEAVGTLIHRQVVAKAESKLGDRLGIPDFGVVADGALCGYVELKKPGDGADTSRFRGRNKEQWERFRSQPNIIYAGSGACIRTASQPSGYSASQRTSPNTARTA
jgi:hypothetical protein